MSSVIEVKVPDIGDFKDVPVIEVLVKPGDSVKKEDSLVTLESDKATMEVPAPEAGVVKELKVKLGDKVVRGRRDPAAREPTAPSRGKAPAAKTEAPAPKRRHLRPSGAPAAVTPRCARRAGRGPPAPGSPRATSTPMSWCSGSGPGGYTAAFRAADLGQESGADRALRRSGRRVPERRVHPVQSAAARRTRALGSGGDVALRPQVRQAEDRSGRAADLERERRRERHQGAFRARQAAQSAGRHRRGEVHLAAHMVEVQTAEGKKTVSFDTCIIAAGSQVGQDPRLSLRRPAPAGLHQRARAEGHPQAAAGHRRRHHRPGDGHGVRRAGLQDHRGGAAGWPDPRRGPRHHPAAAQAHREALRGHLPEDQGHQDRGDARKGSRPPSRAKARRSRRSTTACCCRSDAGPTARPSTRKPPACW